MMRELSKDEETLIIFLLAKSGNNIAIPQTAITMNDSDMGSITFDFNGMETRFEQIAGGEFLDEDGVLVDFELTVNSKGELFELDFWKVDFSKLLCFPKPNRIQIKSTATFKR